MTTTRKLATAALTAAALVVPAAAAQAVPADLNNLGARGAQAAQSQAVQSQAAAQDRHAAYGGDHSQPSSTVASRPLPAPPSWPVNPQPLTPASSGSGSSGDGIDAATIGLGIAGCLLAVGGIAGVSQRRRRRPSQRARIAA